MGSVALNFQQKSLAQQGYDYSPEALRKLTWGLRFTPSLCMLIAIYGLVTQQPAIHFALAALGIVPFWMPAWHPLDILYNNLIRPLWHGVKLPPNPLQRRIACLMGGLMNICIAVSFLAHQAPLAYLFGAFLTGLQLIVITTHFCVASWLFERFMKLFGLWSEPLPVAEIKAHLQDGAQLIDVRNPDEFQQEHLPDALNIPVAEIGARSEELQGKPVIVYCRTGIRSQEAFNVLRKKGCKRVYNLGAMSRF